MKKRKKIIAVISATFIVAYIIYAVYLLIVHPTDTYIIKQGTLAVEEGNVGYIIRNEIVLKEENNENGIYEIATEEQKVAVNESIFRYYSDDEKQITQKINELNYQIQILLDKEENIPSSADIKAIENQVEKEIETINTLTNIQEIIETKKNIDELISKKIDFIGELTQNNEIKDLVKQKNTFEGKLKNGTEYQKTKNMAGIVSYRVDGLEQELSPNNFDSITEEYLKNLDLKTGQIIPKSTTSGKIIDNFKCYIAVVMDSDKAMTAKVGDSVKIRKSNSIESIAKIVQINEEENERVIIFQLNTMESDFIEHRKISVEIIWWQASGLKIPKQALIEENELYYVMRNKAGIQNKILVKVKGQTDKFAIIVPYTVSELLELGYSQAEANNYRQISGYDEIIIQ